MRSLQIDPYARDMSNQTTVGLSRPFLASKINQLFQAPSYAWDAALMDCHTDVFILDPANFRGVNFLQYKTALCSLSKLWSSQKESNIINYNVTLLDSNSHEHYLCATVCPFILLEPELSPYRMFWSSILSKESAHTGFNQMEETMED